MQSPNRLLSRLSPEELGVLWPHLEAVDLPVRKQLEARNKAIDAIYFIEHGIASVVADGTGRSSRGRPHRPGGNDRSGRRHG